MNKVGKIIIRFFLIGFIMSSTVSAIQVEANAQLGESHQQEVIITKYALNRTSVSTLKATGLKLNNISLSSDEEALSPVPNIIYQFQQIVPAHVGAAISLKDESTYKKVGKELTLVTNSDGIATCMLRDGVYIISEVANPRENLRRPAVPVLIRLPVENLSKKGYLDKVYLYPKSSVDPVSSQKAVAVKTRTNHTLPETGDTTSKLSNVFMGCICFVFAIIVLKEKRGGRN